MVVIIKGNHLHSDVDVIAKTMINMETDKYMYRVNNEPNSMTKFNKYTYDTVEFDCIVNYGKIIVTNEIDITVFINLLKAKCSILQPDKTEYILKSFNNEITTVKKKSKRAIGVYGSIYKTADFEWRVSHVLQRIVDKIYISEFSKYSLNSNYLNSSISCIIYDNSNVYNTLTYTKQLNYPALTQYNDYPNKITDVCIKVLVDLNLIGFNIIQHYNKDFNINDIYSTVNTISKFEDLQIRRVNLKRKWYDELNERYDYDKQEQLELLCEETGKPKFPNDYCFMTHAPLYNCACALYLQNEMKEQCVILVSPYIIDAYMNKEPIESAIYKLTGFKICLKAIVKINRTEIEAINMMNVSPIKKKILIGISKYGYVFYTISRYNLFISTDDNGQLYFGVNSLTLSQLKQLSEYDAIYYKY